MKWIKKGRIITPSDLGIMQWGDQTHTQIPIPYILDNGNIRMFFSIRKDGRSLPTYIDLDKNTLKIVEVNMNPLMELGKRGAFDEFGVMPTDIIKVDKELWMYYVGWQIGISVSYTLAVGLAISSDNGKTFRRAFEGPILGRTKSEPYMTMSPYLYKDKDIWHMFYASGMGFIKETGRYEPRYLIMSATSKNGIDWERNGQVNITGKTVEESNTRPTIIKIGDKYHMWFCYRGGHCFRNGENSYQIGYAWSKDLQSWSRDDEKAGIYHGLDGEWDEKMMAYPYVKKINEKYYMFYNGNGFGQSGIGYAIYDLGEDN